MFHRLAAIVAACSLVMLLAATATAGGWADIKADPAGTTEPPREGQPTEIGFTVLQHGVTPAGWVHPSVAFTNAVTGQTVNAIATPEGADGHFVARVTLPAAGAWSWSVTLTDLMVEPQPFTLSVLTASGAPAPLDTASLLQAIEQAKVSVRSEIAAETGRQVDALSSEIAALQRQADRMEHRVSTITADRDALAAQLAEGSAPDGVSILGVIALAVLAGATAGFAMAWLAGRPGPTVKLDPAPRGSSQA